MYIKLCDRCGRVTENKVAFLLPSKNPPGIYEYNGVQFSNDGITLCNNCLDDFEKFRTEHESFNQMNKLIRERNKDLERCEIK